VQGAEVLGLNCDIGNYERLLDAVDPLRARCGDPSILVHRAVLCFVLSSDAV
jgi:hypothetical protein